jgi:hypothetical protein
LADETAGHLAEVLLLGRDDPAVRAAVAEGYTVGLGFHGDDVGLDGWANGAERDGFRDGDDEQGAFGVGDFGNGGNVFNDSKEVGALNEHGGCFGGDLGLEGFKIDAAGFGVVNGLGGRRYSGWTERATTALWRPVTRTAIMRASAAPVDPSYMLALATSMPVSSAIMVWNSKMAWRVPWVISAW